jgi:hypothetical protein
MRAQRPSGGTVSENLVKAQGLEPQGLESVACNSASGALQVKTVTAITISGAVTLRTSRIRALGRSSRQRYWGTAMYLTTPGCNPLQSIFGNGYVPEFHADESQRNLPPSEGGETDLDFGEILKALRSALGLR